MALRNATNDDPGSVEKDLEQAQITREEETIKKKKLVTLDEEERKEFLHEVMILQHNLKLSVANNNILASTINTSFRTVRRLWDQIKNSIKFRSKSILLQEKIVKCGRNRKYCFAFNAAIKTINYKDGKTLRLLQELQ